MDQQEESRSHQGTLEMALWQYRKDGGKPRVSLNTKLFDRHRNYSINPVMTETQHRRAASLRTREQRGSYCFVRMF